MVKQSKGRLKSLIMDAGSRAQEQLMSMTTVEEAAALVEKIPTVAEAIELVQSQDGIQRFYHRLNPDRFPALPPPPTQEEDKVEVLPPTKRDPDDGDEEDDLDTVVNDHRWDMERGRF
jgi:hypothetical protein